MDLRANSSVQKPRAKRSNGPYRGVWKRNDKWVSEIRIPKTNEKIWLGSHDSAVKAAKAYDAAMYCIHGAGELFNFPNNGRPQLADHQIGCLSADEIQRIAREFASIVPAPSGGSSMLLSNISRDMIEVKLEQKLLPFPTNNNNNTSQVEAYIPVFVPQQTPIPIPIPIPYGSLPFDETFIKDSDEWILDFMADPSSSSRQVNEFVYF